MGSCISTNNQEQRYVSAHNLSPSKLSRSYLYTLVGPTFRCLKTYISARYHYLISQSNLNKWINLIRVASWFSGWTFWAIYNPIYVHLYHSLRNLILRKQNPEFAAFTHTHTHTHSHTHTHTYTLSHTTHTHTYTHMGSRSPMSMRHDDVSGAVLSFYSSILPLD